MNLFRKILGDLYSPFTKFIHEAWALIFPKWYVRYLYKKVLKKKLDLRNPKDFNEKIQWLKIYSDTSQWTTLADKYKVREYVTQCGLGDSLVKLYGVWERAEEIDFNKLPDSFVLKTNHGYGRVILVNDKSKLDISLTITQLNKWVKEKYGLVTFEPHYWNIERRIIAEELLQDNYNAEFSSSLIDYKFYCFNGEPDIVELIYDRKIITVGSNVKRKDSNFKACAFDLDWNPLPEIYTEECDHHIPTEIPKPGRLDKMLEICKTLSLPFPSVRVDLYEVNNKVYFGEMTFTPGGGMNFFTPEYFLEMGDLIDLSTAKRRTKRPII